tara:strand:+ start:244 stop:768 length:525 start_codon:yes stop_codon:yes gene_type:complete
MSEEKVEVKEVEVKEKKEVEVREEVKENKEVESKRVAAIRVRGLVKLEKKVKSTLELLNLDNKNTCVVLQGTPTNTGMLKAVKDYITWGEIGEDTYKSLKEKRGEEYTGRESDSKKKYKYNKFISEGDKKLKKFFRLNSPVRGFGRKGIKVPFNQGGALGFRGDKINDLIKRML